MLPCPRWSESAARSRRIETMGEQDHQDAMIKRSVPAATEQAAESGGPTGARLRRPIVVLRDGVRVTLRPVAPDDRQRLVESFAGLSEESRYRRFFAAKTGLTESELDYLVDVDHCDHEAIVAIDRSNDALLGVARYVRWPDDPEVAEVAVTVADDWQGRGLGRALLDR
jgi:GNAT superfamily N-acetyltransferase